MQIMYAGRLYHRFTIMRQNYYLKIPLLFPMTMMVPILPAFGYMTYQAVWVTISAMSITDDAVFRLIFFQIIVLVNFR